MNTENTDKISTDRAERRLELGETKFSTGSQGGALMQPKNGAELMDMANMMSSAGTMIRDFYRNSPGDCAALIMICQPYGLNPYMVSWKTYKASKGQDAPVSFEAQLVMSMVNQSAPIEGRLKYTYEGEGQTRQCTAHGIDRDDGEVIEYTSPMLKDIGVKNSPLWKNDPDQQLAYFAARSWARRHFPELLLGVYTREEVAEAPAIRDVTPESDLTKRLKAAQAEPEVMEEPTSSDVEKVSTPTEESLPSRDINEDIEDADVSEAFNPLSDEFTKGVEAYQEGLDCVNDDLDWIAGWRQAQEAEV